MKNTFSSKGAAFLRHGEGFVDHWYLDPVGIGTIGVGFTWRSEAFQKWWNTNKPGQPFANGAKMTRKEADDCLTFLINNEYGKAVDKFLGKQVAQHVFDGAVSPVFNLGPGALNWKWAAALKAGNLNEAAERLKVTGITAGGKKLTGLKIRRKEEAELIEFGDYAFGKTYLNDPMEDGLLRRGERGDVIGDIQVVLGELGFYNGTIDGIFGFGTEAAVMEFQRANKLEPDGVADQTTLELLLRAPTEPIEAPKEIQPEPIPQPVQPRGYGWLLLAAIVIIAVAALVVQLLF